jgi:hypothetical protein
MSGPWGDLVTSSWMRRRKQKNFVVRMSWLMFEEPRGRPEQSNEDDGVQELRILTEACQRGTEEHCHADICKREDQV